MLPNIDLNIDLDIDFTFLAFNAGAADATLWAQASSLDPFLAKEVFLTKERLDKRVSSLTKGNAQASGQ